MNYESDRDLVRPSLLHIGKASKERTGGPFSVRGSSILKSDEDDEDADWNKRERERERTPIHQEKRKRVFSLCTNNNKKRDGSIKEREEYSDLA